MESEAPGGIGLRSVGMPRGAFEAYFGGWDRDAVVVDDDSRAICDLRARHLSVGKDPRQRYDPDQESHQPHAIPSRFEPQVIKLHLARCEFSFLNRRHLGWTTMARGCSTARSAPPRSEEHTLNSSHGYISYAVFCL